MRDHTSTAKTRRSPLLCSWSPSHLCLYRLWQVYLPAAKYDYPTFHGLPSLLRGPIPKRSVFKHLRPPNTLLSSTFYAPTLLTALHPEVTIEVYTDNSIFSLSDAHLTAQQIQTFTQHARALPRQYSPSMKLSLSFFPPSRPPSSPPKPPT